MTSGSGGGQRPRSCTSFVLNSSTLFCRITIVGMKSWRLAGIPDRSPLSGLREQRDRLVAELVRLLHDGADDRARLDARQRLVVFVERDDLDLADPAGVADRVEDRRAVVAPQADERRDVGMAHEHLGDVRLGADLIGVVRANVDDLDRRAGDRLLDALQPLLGVARVELPDEERDPAALRQRFLDQLARLPAGGDVVGADVALALAAGRVAVVREDERLLRRRRSASPSGWRDRPG